MSQPPYPPSYLRRCCKDDSLLIYRLSSWLRQLLSSWYFSSQHQMTANNTEHSGLSCNLSAHLCQYIQDTLGPALAICIMANRLQSGHRDIRGSWNRSYTLSCNEDRHQCSTSRTMTVSGYAITHSSSIQNKDRFKRVLALGFLPFGILFCSTSMLHHLCKLSKADTTFYFPQAFNWFHPELYFKALQIQLFFECHLAALYKFK